MLCVLEHSEDGFSLQSNTVMQNSSFLVGRKDGLQSKQSVCASRVIMVFLSSSLAL